MSNRRSRIAIAVVTLLSLVTPVLVRNAQAASSGSGGASINLTKTVGSATVNPHLGLTLGVDRSSAIPGDALKYTATLTSGASSLDLGGTFTAVNNGNMAATISAYYDDLEYYNNSTTWVTFAVTSASAPGYTPLVAPPTGPPLALTATSNPATGVTYPASGDPILDTQLATPSTASWNYQTSFTLSPTLISTLSDGTKVGGLRNVVHFEATPRATANGQPFTRRAEFANPFLNGPVAVKNITIAITPPGLPEVDFTPATTPALASLAPNASVSVSTTSTVPAPAPKGATMSDADYLAALGTVEGSTLTGKATATGTSLTGTVTTGPATASTTEHVPILSLTKSGPAIADAGATATYPLALGNSGGATASGLSITDGLPDGSAGTVSAIPTSLAAGASGTAQATYPIPASQPDGSLTDTTTVSSSYNGATLTLSPSSAGPDVTGTSQSLEATLLGQSGAPLVNQTISFAVTGPNGTSGTGTTDSNGIASFSYSGANNGTDTVQATASKGSVTLQSNTSTVNWITPVQQVTTSTVTGRFFPEGTQQRGFSAQPGQTPAFTESFPTIDFNPPSGTIKNPPPGYNIGVSTRPFTDVTTDLGANYTGQVVAQGNGYQAGLATAAGDMTGFDAAFTATFVVAAPGDVTFNFFSDDGFIFGVGNGAARVGGDNYNTPSTSVGHGEGDATLLGYARTTGYQVISRNTRLFNWVTQSRRGPPIPIQLFNVGFVRIEAD